MKSIILVQLLCLCALGFVSSQNYLGYGVLTPYNVYTFDNVNNIQYSKILSPTPQNVMAFAGVSTNASYSFNAIYSNNQNSITWGLINFATGAITDLHTTPSPTSNQNNLSGFALLERNDTIYYLYTSKSTNNYEISLIQTKFGTSGFVVSLPVLTTPYSSGTLGTFDQSSGTDYFVVTITSRNQYECYWVDVVTNQVIKTITVSNTQANQVFDIFAYNRNLYIVQGDSTGRYVETYLVDWGAQTMSLVARAQVSSQPISIQVSLSTNYFAIFSIGRGESTPTVPLIALSNYVITDFIVGLPSSNQNTYFLF